MDPITLLTGASSITERGPVRRVLPAAALVVLFLGLIVSGAAYGPPRMDVIASQLKNLGAVGAAVLTLSVAASAIFIAPVFGYLSGVLQGTMMTGPLLKPLRTLLIRRHRRRQVMLSQQWQKDMSQWAADRMEPSDLQTELSDLEIQLSRMPELSDLRPTTLGNVLAAADDYSASRYGLDARVTLPRLLRVVPPDVRPVVDGQLQDLQFASEMCGALILASLMSEAFLVNDGRWALLPFSLLILAWLSYRNAVAAAVVYGETQRVLFDLYRFSLYDVLGLSRPKPPDLLRPEPPGDSANRCPRACGVASEQPLMLLRPIGDRSIADRSPILIRRWSVHVRAGMPSSAGHEVFVDESS